MYDFSVSFSVAYLAVRRQAWLMRSLSSVFLWERSLGLGVCPVSKMPSEHSEFGNKCQLAVVEESVLILLMIAKTCSLLCAFGSFALAICLKCQLHVLLSSS